MYTCCPSWSSSPPCSRVPDDSNYRRIRVIVATNLQTVTNRIAAGEELCGGRLVEQHHTRRAHISAALINRPAPSGMSITPKYSGDTA
jgi:hypothetical protein